jgi:hypothetical protein
LNKYPKLEQCEHDESFKAPEMMHKQAENKAKIVRVIREMNSKQELIKEKKMCEDNKKRNVSVIPITAQKEST